MTTLLEDVALGDVILNEQGQGYCREEREVTRNLTASVGLVVGEMVQPDVAVAAVQTYTTETAPEIWIADGGTYRLGYKGYWTTVLAQSATVATINTALDVLVALSGGSAGDIVFANVGGDLLITTNTFTFLNTLGNVQDIVLDLRLLTDATFAGRFMDGHASIATTTVGTLVAMSTIIGAAVTCVQSVTITNLAAGAVRIKFTNPNTGQTNVTGPLAHAATTADIETEVDNTIGTGIVAIAGTDIDVFTITFDQTDASWASRPVPLVEILPDTAASATARAQVVMTTPGFTAGGQCDGILLEKVSLTELQDNRGQKLRRPFLVRGSALVNQSNLSGAAASLTGAIAALVALGILMRSEPTVTDVGTPSG